MREEIKQGVTQTEIAERPTKRPNTHDRFLSRDTARGEDQNQLSFGTARFGMVEIAIDQK